MVERRNRERERRVSERKRAKLTIVLLKNVLTHRIKVLVQGIKMFGYITIDIVPPIAHKNLLVESGVWRT